MEETKKEINLKPPRINPSGIKNNVREGGPQPPLLSLNGNPWGIEANPNNNAKMAWEVVTNPYRRASKWEKGQSRGVKGSDIPLGQSI